MANKAYAEDGTNDRIGSRTTARVQVIHETAGGPAGDWRLCFQWCRYFFGNGDMEEGYRFIWRRPDNSLQAARGQARIESIEVARQLMQRAEEEGWGQYEG